MMDNMFSSRIVYCCGVEAILDQLTYDWSIFYNPTTNNYSIQFRKASGKKFTTSVRELMEKYKTADELFAFFEEEYNRE